MSETTVERARRWGWKTAREAAQRIAEIHPPGAAELVESRGSASWMGRWQAEDCPRWIAEITAIIAARDAEIAAEQAEPKR